MAMVLLGLTLASPARADDAQVYLVGVVPQFDSRTIYDTWTPILAQLQAITGLRLQLVGSPNIPDFEKRVGQQEFDFAYLNPYQGLVASANYVPLVRDVRTPLEGIIVVRKGGPIQDLRDLQGKHMDFPAPNALAASLMTRAHLDQAGVQIEARYVKTHTSVYLNVALGQAVAGGGVLQTLAEQPASVRDQLQVIYKTAPVASHPVIGNKRLGEDIRERVRAAFIKLGGTPEGQALLVKIPFDKVGATTAEDYAPLKRMGLERFYVPN